MRKTIKIMWAVTGVLLIIGVLVDQSLATDETRGPGIAVRRGAVVLYGNPANCSRPAVAQLKKLQRATAEWKTIRAKRVREGTGRYDILIARMNRRIKAAVRLAAEAAECDCVVRKGDVLDPRGLKVRDLTDEIRSHLDGIDLGVP